MRHDEFIGQVQARARLSSRGEAEAATRAALETLGERVPERAADHLADQLPAEIGEHLRRTEIWDGAGPGERFDFEEFAHRVAERGHLHEPDAIYRTRVVLEVTGEATEGVLGKVRDQLPADLRPLVDAGSSGPLR
ncbi:DUF2267 domain-containing protein [Actinoalloteichus hymeniacidonis]|uniref:DUF2267 domain-containing protein n=1 Tax=Actinoalloteichus hymeniacidonis TaxID=340345 RepID=A0AAC9MXF3_9PSEU|nr:DUF2267 domain-containing protein [Actinoalloteichus hymeniacidonis]AOS63148.1 hypothetical protein TL08_11670 [Actinoalloteichus hymeniacidonis]MBB5908815.1 uncharacterized protein (DUF2267 family) [Actinoalloteichus hymeniacidonis]